MAEVARLRIRYRNFPGARDIQRDLDVILQQWDMTEDELFFPRPKTTHPRENIR